MGDILEGNLRNVARLLRDDWDWVTVIDGYERVGKSTLALQMSMLVDFFRRHGLEEPYVPEPMDLSHVVFDWKSLKNAAVSLPHYSAIFYDEARMLTRERMKEWNVAMVQALSVIGFRNQFFVFNFPDFWELDPYIKDHRCRIRVHVRSWKGHRGYSLHYVAKKRPFKSKSTRRSTWWEFGFHYTFASLEDASWSDEVQDFWRRYREKEVRAKEKILTDEEENPRETYIIRMVLAGHTDRVIADGLPIGISQVSKDRQRLQADGRLPSRDKLRELRHRK